MHFGIWWDINFSHCGQLLHLVWSTSSILQLALQSVRRIWLETRCGYRCANLFFSEHHTFMYATEPTRCLGPTGFESCIYAVHALQCSFLPPEPKHLLHKGVRNDGNLATHNGERRKHSNAESGEKEKWYQTWKRREMFGNNGRLRILFTDIIIDMQYHSNLRGGVCLYKSCTANRVGLMQLLCGLLFGYCAMRTLWPKNGVGSFDLL